MNFPEIKGVDMATVMLLGTWFFVALQFCKGKVWPDGWTARISLILPLLLAWVPVWGSPKMNAYAQVQSVIFLVGTGFWAINKAGRPENGAVLAEPLKAYPEPAPTVVHQVVEVESSASPAEVAKVVTKKLKDQITRGT